ncbi:MAG: T9SS C-terminal target domain-containing protein [Ignavibacteriales bacterium]|nr:MAG: T9SS C-terminal target domain-containing protein [Ignavibacteriales bacterium]
MLTKLLPIVICFFTLTLSSFSQSYKISLENEEYLNDYTYEFDVIIKSTDENFEIICYQACLAVTVDNDLEFSYINNTSQLSNKPLIAVGTIQNNNNYRVLTFASAPGSDIISQSEKRIGRFRLTSSQPLITNRAFIFWNFEGDIRTILIGSGFTNITAGGEFLPKMNNLRKAEVTTIEDEELIKEFELMQNYPNPFNPSTTIKYSLPFDSSVKLKVFNVLGEEVKILVDDFLPSGNYEIRFDAGSLPSGYYIYTLYVDNKIFDTKKMILVK